MKNIKDITLLAFAVIGFYTIITAFSSTESNQPQQVYGTPESHVWEFHFSAPSSTIPGRASSINKVTGEVRFYERSSKKFTKNGKTYTDEKYIIKKAVD